jgi:hypothetical protein
MSEDRRDARDGLHAATPAGWWVGSPSYHASNLDGDSATNLSSSSGEPDLLASLARVGAHDARAITIASAARIERPSSTEPRRAQSARFAGEMVHMADDRRIADRACCLRHGDRLLTRRHEGHGRLLAVHRLPGIEPPGSLRMRQLRLSKSCGGSGAPVPELRHGRHRAELRRLRL